ncbi:zinc finger bed domain-containing protein 1-like [Gigaspora margarita]|uniref:Zinc finger bed domain-containing protein 1-like n=1 Tax=Gigaspora margarita TaxID=4874 RepID=A0A8H3X2K5_GIGMA|nr:zinc finger bed domain-containing protein 1-like [Gigaspora margarita]
MGSFFICMESVKVNHVAISLTITELVANKENIEKIVEKTVYSKTYWNNLSKLIDILKELIIGISIFESDTPQLSYFYEWYHNYFKSIQNSKYDDFINNNYKN